MRKVNIMREKEGRGRPGTHTQLGLCITACIVAYITEEGGRLMWLKLSLSPPTECGKSTNCRLRLLFIDICDMILDTFSRSFFKENFFEAVLELAHVSEKHNVMHASTYQLSLT